MRFLSHLLYVGSGHNELLDNFLILAEFVRQFAKLVLELVQLHVLNIQVVLRVLYNLSDLRHLLCCQHNPNHRHFCWQFRYQGIWQEYLSF